MPFLLFFGPYARGILFSLFRGCILNVIIRHKTQETREKNMKHRSLSAVLALMLAVSLFPAAALAEGAGGENGLSIPNGGDAEAALMLYEDYGDTRTLTIDKNSEKKNYRLSELYYAEGETLIDLFEDGTESLVCGYLLDTPEGPAEWTVVGKVIYYPDESGGSNEVMLENLEWDKLTSGKNYLLMIKPGERWYKQIVAVTDNSQQGGDDVQPGTFVVQYEGENYAAGSTLVLSAGPDNVVALMVRTENGWSLVGDSSLIKFGEGVITNIAPVHKENEGTDQLWRVIIAEEDGEGAASWIQYGEDENNRVNITVRSAPQPSGQLEVNYDGSFVRGLTLGAGTYDVELRLWDEENNKDWWLGEKYTNWLSVDETIVKSIEQDRFKDDDAHDVFMWKITVAAPESGSASGWIKYSDGKNESQVDIKVLAAHGDKVSDGDFIDAEVDNGELIIKIDGETYRSNVAKINWPMDSDNEYYLAACEWRDKLLDISPKGHGFRGLMDGSNNHMYLSARVFQRVEGESGSDDVKYFLNENVRAKMIEAGYTFDIVLHPAEGSGNYPTRETVEMTSLSPENGDMALNWEHLYYGDSSTAGWWVYEAQLVNAAETVVARSFSSEKFQSMALERVTLEESDVETINRQIADTLNHCSENDDYTLPMVEFILPAGTIEGRIIIPKTKCFISLVGAGNNRGVISTTIRGGVRLDGADCDLHSIHFIGAGKDQETSSDGLPNVAAYGYGEGIPRGCILEGYYCAISSEDCSSWAANQSVFLNNHIGIRMSALGGGNLRMIDNWFVGNDTALLVEKSIGADAMESSSNRFVNNKVDLENNSDQTGWMSQNFFYHDHDENKGWMPVLWNEDIGNGSLNFCRDEQGRICADNSAPEFETTGNYNTLRSDGDPQYLNFLPWFDGKSKTFAYPLARTQSCDSFFYPNWRDPNQCPKWWPEDDPYYPSYVQRGVTISESELDGLHFSSYDSSTDTAIGTFDFGAAGTEN